MSRHLRRAALPGLFASIMSVIMLVPAAAAQDASCTLSPLSLPLFDATPAAVIASTPQPSAESPELDENGATAAIEMLLACAGEESQALRYAIFTDAYLARLFIGEDAVDQPAFELLIDSGVVPEPFASSLNGLSDFDALDDGRFAVTIQVMTADGTVEDRIVLAWDADQEQWLIDEIVSLDPPPGTPAGSEGAAAVGDESLWIRYDDT